MSRWCWSSWRAWPPRPPGCCTRAGRRQPAAIVGGTHRNAAIVLKPVSAHGFDALNLADSGDENDNQAQNAIDGNPQGWSTQQYLSHRPLGNLKAGTGLILDMGRPVKLSSITIQFGSAAGADVQIKLGNSATRSAANEESMADRGQRDQRGRPAHLHRHRRAGTGQFVVIWFTKLPPAGGQFMAQILNIIVRGTAA